MLNVKLHNDWGICQMKKWLMAVLFGIMLVLGACGGGDDDAQESTDPAESDDPDTEESEDTESDDEGGEVTDDAAEELYQESCASCHGDDLEGSVGPSLETIGADLSADEIEGVIEEGQGSMPAGLLSGDDAEQVAKWLSEHE